MIVPFNKEGRCASVQSEGHITDGEMERKSTTHRRKTEKRDKWKREHYTDQAS